MDDETFGAALAVLKTMPNTASYSAAQAAASAEAAQQAADSISPATDAEVKTVL